MDVALLQRAIVDAFQSKDALDNWVSLHSGEQVDNVLTKGRLDERATELIKWAEASGKTTTILQALADNPPNGSTTLPAIISLLTANEVQPTAARRRGIPPIAPHRDWFVTSRPFANRQDLRDVLETLDAAAPGPDSVLVIDGDHLSGKSYSIRFAVQCAPPDRFVVVDVHDWQESILNAKVLAENIDPAHGTYAPFDETKESAAVPNILAWLSSRLQGRRHWIIVDHCSRGNLTEAAESLLFKLAGKIEKGFLPGTRLVLADVQRSRLPDSLKTKSRYDRAALPTREHVKLWCKTLGHHIGKPPTSTTLDEYVDEVFAGVTTATSNSDFVTLLEERLSTVFDKIRTA